MLCEKALQPHGLWFVLLKYSDGTPEDVASPNLPADLRLMMRCRKAVAHACVVAGQEDHQRTPQVYDLERLPDPHAWLLYPTNTGQPQLRWENRNLNNAKITLLALEYFFFSYSSRIEAPLPKGSLLLAALCKRPLWFEKALQAATPAEINQLGEANAAAIHCLLFNARGPSDVLEASLLRLLLEHPSADVNLRAGNSPLLMVNKPVSETTPLHWAAVNNAPECAKVLLAHAAVQKDAVDSNGQTALFLACIHESMDTLKVLLQAGASTKIADGLSRTPGQVAVKLKNTAMLQLLAEARS
jgi:hypothetical protein